MGDVRVPLTRRLIGLGLVAVAGLTLAVGAAPPAAAEGTILGFGNPNAIPDNYLVVYRDGATAQARDLTASLAAEAGATVTHTYSHALRGFAATMGEKAARQLAADPAVAFVEQDARVSVAATQSPVPSWGLDRIDQNDLPLNNSYTYPNTASGVTAYVIDTGIRTTHSEFGGRAVWGFNAAGDGSNTDCNGHGTHVAGTLGGSSFGVAKGVRLVAVKVLNCSGSGSFAGIVAGVDWVTANHTAGPAVANLSLGASGSNTTLENAVRNSISDGIVYTIASGNSNSNACDFTPARVAEAITVNASTITDTRASFSNYGSCTDIFAPGQNITSTWITSDFATNTMSGTSMAAPHVAGGVALILGESPSLAPPQVWSLLSADAALSKITSAGSGSPNRLLSTARSVKRDVQYWNDVLLEAFRRQGGGPGPLARAAAMMHAGLFDAVNSATLSKQGSTPYASYRTLQSVHQSVNQNLAASYTARDLLSAALPAQSSFVQQKFTELHGSSSQTLARQLADAVVNDLTAARANDGSGATTSYTPEGVPGSWRPTDGCTTVDSHWGGVTPFTLTSGSQFRRPPLATSYAALLASGTYASQLADVRSLGQDGSSTRTPDQTQAAWFWANDLDGTYKPPGQLLAHTAIVADSRPLDGLQLARLFALVSLAMVDAGIAAWDQKYLTSLDLWRPETAIQQDATNPDPNWEPLSADRNNVSFSPCFPAWVSGHATFAAAWAGIMRSEFGDAVTFTATTEDPHALGVTRTFTSFTAAATENARSRVYLGVHYQFDADDGQATGYDVANHVYNNYLRPGS